MVTWISQTPPGPVLAAVDEANEFFDYPACITLRACLYIREAVAPRPAIFPAGRDGGAVELPGADMVI